MSDQRQRVAVIGGGVSGLAAAYQLAHSDADLHVSLFEAAEKLGGVVQTEHADGYCFELGPDSMLSRQPWAIDLCRRAGIADKLINTNEANRGAHVVRRGKLLRIPDGLAVMAPERIWPFVTTPILSWGGKLRVAAEPFVRRRTDASDESLAEFARRRLGKEAFDRLVQPLASGIFMGDPERLSMEAAFPQFRQMESTHGSLVRGARDRRAKRSGAASSGGPRYSLFVAPQRGIGQMAAAIAEQLGRQCQVFCNSPVDALQRGSEGAWLLDIGGGPETRREAFRGIVIALPAYRAGALLSDVDPEAAELLDGIHYASCVVVNIAFRRSDVAHPLDSFGFVTPHVERRSLAACTFSSVKYQGRAPDDVVLLRAFLGGEKTPQALDWTDQRVLDVVQEELRELLGATGKPLTSRITRWRRSMPQYHVGHQSHVDQIDRRVEHLPRLELAGNAYHGVGIPQCVRGGQQAGDRLLAALDGAETTQPINFIGNTHA
ncbi:MAG: protoporphyrinogen oxidase [Planctomycetota bacterium]